MARTSRRAKRPANRPPAATTRAGLRPGADDTLHRYAGCLTGVYRKGALRELRRDWARTDRASRRRR